MAQESKIRFGPIKRIAGKPEIVSGNTAIRLGRRQAEISRRPLVKQDTSDASNERRNRLASGLTAAQMLIKGTQLNNRVKKILKSFPAESAIPRSRPIGNTTTLKPKARPLGNTSRLPGQPLPVKGLQRRKDI